MKKEGRWEESEEWMTRLEKERESAMNGEEEVKMG